MSDDISSYQVRAELEGLLERDLLGPWDGPEEELPHRTRPSELYMLGRLVPREQPSEPEETQPELVDREVTSAEEEEDEGAEADATIRSGSMACSAIGLAFSVERTVDEISVFASWGRYERARSDTQETPTGRAAVTWHRRPAGGPVTVRTDAEGLQTLVPDPGQEGVTIRAVVRHRGARRVVELSLVNEESDAGKARDETRLFQAGLTVTATDGGAAIFLGHNDPAVSDPPSAFDDERLHLELLHRATRQYAQGRQCAVDAAVRDGETRAWMLATTCFPAAEVPLVEPGKVPGLVLDMRDLGSTELGRDDLVQALRPLVTGYQRWLSAQESRIDSDPEIRRYGKAGPHAVEAARDVAARLERAIELLRTDGQAREAFRFANQAMAMQRVRSEVVRARLADPAADVAALLRSKDVPTNRSWRPFQLAFVLLCLPGLTSPSHPDAARTSSDAEVQLLFFPTGGGKTEAYLGLAAYTFAVRRLQGVVGSGSNVYDGTRGVAVLMRYTLRLLTAQQFQRAAALLCACETLRRERIDAGDSRWGTTPFRIGLWVGSSVAPNSFGEAETQITESRGAEGAVGGVLQLPVCPWCGSRLSSGRDVKTDRMRRRVLVYCSDPEGDCEFSPRKSPDEGLPVLTVDEEIYRLTPALVIATVDKLAQLPWKAATSTLFGLVGHECTRHGWQLPDSPFPCGSGGHRATGDLPEGQIRSATRLRPPDLIIQDELHLISDALGSMVGLYETAIDRLCTRSDPSGAAVRPVLVASTATVRRAREQVNQVFARGLTVFPPPVLDAGDTYFSSLVPPSAASPGRRYRGVLAPGGRLKSIEVRVASALLEHAQYLFDRYGAAADPYMTLVDYFTSTRELAGMRRLVEDEVADRLRSRKVRTRRRRPIVEELTGRIPSSKIATSLAQLENRFDPSLDSTAALDHYRQQQNEPRTQTPGRTAHPIDVLLATSMLQVGVDVQRLGLMAVTGQPKNTAEYIQATSRVGRSAARPGLVVTIYHWSRPRDLAHYETFGYDHATFGLHVEGLTTTPFSDRALDRGLTAVLVTALRHSGLSSLPNIAAQSVPLTGPLVSALIDALAARAKQVTEDAARADSVREESQRRLAAWSARRGAVATGRLGYKTAPDVYGLLRGPDDGSWNAWSVPMSMREVEEEIFLQLDSGDRSAADAPSWVYEQGATGGEE